MPTHSTAFKSVADMQPKYIGVDSQSTGSTHKPDSDDSQAGALCFCSSKEVLPVASDGGGSTASRSDRSRSARCYESDKNSFSSRGSTSYCGASFDSTVTDFDFLTCPSAQAERNAEYRQALQLAHLQCSGQLLPNAQCVRPRVPPGVWTGKSDHSVQTVLGLLPTYASQPAECNASGDAQLRLKAQALEAYAAELMAKTMQAKADILRMQMDSGTPLQAVSKADPEPRQEQVDSVDVESAPSVVISVPDADRTTVMLRNLPNDYSRSMLLELLDQSGFNGLFNFVYVPMDTHRKVGLGYAFVNLLTHKDAQLVFTKLSGFSDWTVPGSSKVLEVAWGNPLQGLDAHVERYRNSPIMHPDVDEEFRPLLFNDGERVPFPPPTQKIRAPRKAREAMRAVKAQGAALS